MLTGKVGLLAKACFVLLIALMLQGCSMVGAFSNIERYQGSYFYRYHGDGDALTAALVTVGDSQGYHLAGSDPKHVTLTSQVPMIGGMLVGASGNTTLDCRVGDNQVLMITVTLVGNFGTAGKDSADRLATQLVQELKSRGQALSSATYNFTDEGSLYACLSQELSQWPDEALTCNSMAWFLATSNDPSYRDGSLAVQLAQKASSQLKNAFTVGTLAAAYAETGDYAKAVSTQEEAIVLLPPNATGQQRKEWQDHLAAYSAGQPWRRTQVGKL